MSLIEMVLALAMFALLGSGTWSGLHSLQSAARIEAARIDFIVALAAARRVAYAESTTVFAAAAVGDRAVALRRVDGSEQILPLRDGVEVTDAPVRGGVHFLESGWAENSTFTLGLSRGEGRHVSATVIVNQRGRIR
jgi:type II secretory pathway pseudopilin PulG